MSYEQDLIKVHDAIRNYNKKTGEGIMPFAIKNAIIHQLNFSENKARNVIEALIQTGKVKEMDRDTYRLWSCDLPLNNKKIA